MMALAAVAVLTSCTKQDDTGTINKSTKASLSVNVDMSTFGQTRTGDASMTTVPDWDQVLFVVKDKDGVNVTLDKALYTKAELAGKVNLIEKTAGGENLKGGTVEAYITTEGDDWGTLSSTNLPTLASAQNDINNWQVSGNIKTGITGKFANIPFYATDPIVLSTTLNADGHELLEATLVVTPELGRVQVINSPQTGGTLNGTTVSSLNVSNIYLNKVTSNSAVVDIRTENNNVNVDPATWKNNFYDDGKPLSGLTDATTNKGYNLYGNDTPHVVVEVKYKLTTGGAEGPELTGYLTLTKFTYESIVAGDLTVGKGGIYDVDLSKLTPTYDQITDEPYDNTKYYDLITTVTVKTWRKIEVTPGY